MSVELKTLTAINQTDLNDLVLGRTPENIRLEFKRDLYGNNDSSKKELLKDVSAFANSQGGHLIIGIEEQNGIALSVYGATCENPDDEILRMEQAIRSGIEPNIAGIRIRYVALDENTSIPHSYCFILRIPQSNYPPHRVRANHHNRFYVRRSAGVHEPDIEELRQLFTYATIATKPATDTKTSDLTHSQTKPHPLGIYGLILCSTAILLVTMINPPETDWSNIQWFILGSLLFLIQALISVAPLKNQRVTNHIQNCILLCLTLGFATFIIGCITFYHSSFG